MYMFLSFGSGVGADVRGGVEHLCVPQPHQGGRRAALLPPQPPHRCQGEASQGQPLLLAGTYNVHVRTYVRMYMYVYVNVWGVLHLLELSDV